MSINCRDTFVSRTKTFGCFLFSAVSGLASRLFDMVFPLLRPTRKDSGQGMLDLDEIGLGQTSPASDNQSVVKDDFPFAQRGVDLRRHAGDDVNDRDTLAAIKVRKRESVQGIPDGSDSDCRCRSVDNQPWWQLSRARHRR